MKQELKPTYMFESVKDLSFELLQKEDIKGIFLDIDNTIVDSLNNMTEEVDKWLKDITKKGIQICIISNTLNTKKVKALMNKYNIYGVPFAKKPGQKGFEMAFNIIDIPKENILMVGDQIFTDVLGANRFGIRSAYITPISRVEWLGTLIKRPFERAVLKKIKQEGK